MDSNELNLDPPESLFIGFRVATMAPSETCLGTDRSGNSILKQPATPYGLIDRVAIGVSRGQIQWLAPIEQLPAFDQSVKVIDGEGTILSPGLIDCHTHLVYGGNRADEWEMRRGGKSYEEIARAGGGILSTVTKTRAASEQELLNQATDRAISLLAEGVTTIEIKSGYGLNVETELKMLRVANTLQKHLPMSVEATLLGAHAVPPEYKNRPDDYVELVCKEMIPAAKELCSSVDVFCESIAFEIGQTEKVFNAATAAGMKIKVHAEQLTHTGAAAMAARMGALSADHLEYLTDSDCEILAEHGTVATLLPGAFYCLGETQRPPVKSLLSNNVPIAIATDSNPGSSPVQSILLMGNMACHLFGLSPEQSFRGMTQHAATALGLQDSIGMIAPGFQADFAVWDVQSPAEILYGIGHNPCIQVFKHGESTVQLNHDHTH